MISKIFATVVTYAVLLAWTLLVGVYMLVCGPIVGLALRGLRLPLEWNPTEWLPRIWVEVVMFFFRRVMMMRLYVDERKFNIKEGEHSVCLPNHGSTLEMFIWGWYVMHYICHRPTAIVDRVNLKHPIGWGLYGMGTHIFMSRQKREEARRLIVKGVRSLMRRANKPRAIIICVDGGRPKPDNIIHDRRKYPDVSWIGPVLFPREVGLTQLLTGLDEAGARYRVISVTAAFGAGLNIGAFTLWKAYGSSIHIGGRDVTSEVPLDVEKRRNWLIDEWKRKSQHIVDLRSDECLNKIAPARVWLREIVTLATTAAVIMFFF